MLRFFMLQVERQAFLRAIGPHEMRGLAAHAIVVGAREVAHAGALDLDHARAEIGQLPRAERRGDRMLQRDDGNAVQGSHEYSPDQNERGRPSTCSATYDRIRLVEIGATWYRRVSRNLRSASYSCAKPKPPGNCRQALAASHDASAASIFAMLACAPQG